MERTQHTKLVGAGANRFAKEQDVPTVPPGSLVTDYAKYAHEHFKKNGGILQPELGHNVSYQIHFILWELCGLKNVHLTILF